MSKLPTTRLHRNAIVAGTAVKVGVSSLKARTKSLLGANQTSEQNREGELEQAGILFSALGRLKGTALKAAQMLAQENTLVPEAYREELNKACYRAPTLNRAVVRKVFISQFGRPPEALFHRFSYEPFAAASLGQVHLAEDSNGQSLAVKVQYPGITETIRSDMQTLSLVLKAFPSRFSFDSALPEIELRLLEETDYELEYQRQSAFHALCDIPNVRILQPVKAFTRKRVICSPFVTGLHIDEWLDTNPSQHAIDQVCQALSDLFFTSLTQYGLLHADPNIGNFVIDQNNRLVVLDFGCTVPVEKATADTFLDLFRAYKSQNIEQVIALFNRLYMSDEGSPVAMKENTLFIEYLDWQYRMLSPEQFDFGSNPDFISEGIEMAVEAHRCSDFPVVPNKDILFLERVYYGYLRIFQRAGACVRFNLG